MTDAPTTSLKHIEHSEEEAYLVQLGYRPRLRRTLGTFDSFAFAFSYFSALANLTLVLGLGIVFAGPGFIWSWPIVTAGMLLVTFLFCELAANFPLAGSLYNWTKVLAKSKVLPWLTGWLIVAAVIASFAAVGPAYALILPEIWSGFAIVGGTSGKVFAENAVILGTIAFALSTFLNSIGVRAVSRINNIGIRVEVVAGIVITIVFLLDAKRGPGVVFHTNGTGAFGHSSYVGPFLVAAIASMFSLYGMDASSDMAEETKDARRAAPRSMIFAVTGAFFMFTFLAVSSMMAVKNPAGSGFAAGGLAYAISSTFGAVGGRLALAAVMFAIFSATLAINAFAIRVMFGMARDNNLPGAGFISKISERTQAPVNAALIVGVLATAILAINVEQSQIIGVLLSVSTGIVYLAYIGVLVPMLKARMTGRWPLKTADAKRYFSLGKWGYVVNVLALIYLCAGFVDLVWPRSSIYNAVAPFHWYLKWGALLFIGLLVVGGLLLYGFYVRHRTGVLPEHRPESASPIEPVVAPAGPAESLRA